MYHRRRSDAKFASNSRAAARIPSTSSTGFGPRDDANGWDVNTAAFDWFYQFRDLGRHARWPAIKLLL